MWGPLRALWGRLGSLAASSSRGGGVGRGVCGVGRAGLCRCRCYSALQQSARRSARGRPRQAARDLCGAFGAASSQAARDPAAEPAGSAQFALGEGRAAAEGRAPLCRARAASRGGQTFRARRFVGTGAGGFRCFIAYVNAKVAVRFEPILARTTSRGSRSAVLLVGIGANGFGIIVAYIYAVITVWLETGHTRTTRCV